MTQQASEWLQRARHTWCKVRDRCLFGGDDDIAAKRGQGAEGRRGRGMPRP